MNPRRSCARRGAYVLMAATVMFVQAGTAHAHPGALDSNNGHECTQADETAGTCAPAGSYHCHAVPCSIPAGKQVSTSGAPSLSDVQGQIGASPSASVAPSATTAPTSAPIATAAPQATARALSNTGTFTEVLGWTGLAVLFLGLALVLIVPRRRRARALH